MVLKRIVEVVPYQECWKDQFLKEAELLEEIFINEVKDIHHIGSTSIPGMSAKPVIDIMIVVNNIEQVDNHNEEMIKLGYKPLGENGIKGRRFFKKGGLNRTHHVHVFEKRNSEVERHLLFRDYMISHNEVAQAYAELKEKLALTHREDMGSYIDGKDSFIKAIDKAAIIWDKTNR